MLEVLASRETVVGGTTVRRALPQRRRRTVGAWCFADHLGPLPAGASPIGIGPHPHIGLHTVTWLVAGRLLHRDSLGSEQAIRPGQVNLMSAGRGVSHAEEPIDGRQGGMHGIQLWAAQPDATRWEPPAFEHHPVLPEVEVDTVQATVLVGAWAGAVSPARRDSALVGVDLQLRTGSTDLPLDTLFEHALVVLDGAVTVDGRAVTPGHLAFLGSGRDVVGLRASSQTRLLLLGGEPFEAPVVMWWNFVGRSRREMADATRDWGAGSDRFGETGSPMDRVAAPPIPWSAEEESSS
jgi:redox-sensitive bicupin YhaK (pirin superfamily)